MQIGDAVIVKHGRYSFTEADRDAGGEMPWVWEEHLGIITASRRFSTVGADTEYRVYTLDGKHSWAHVGDLRIAT
jgi:hypothetical protein